MRPTRGKARLMSDDAWDENDPINIYNAGYDEGYRHAAAEQEALTDELRAVLYGADEAVQQIDFMMGPEGADHYALATATVYAHAIDELARILDAPGARR